MNDVRERYLEGLLRDVGDSNTKLRAQLAEAAAFLDRHATTLLTGDDWEVEGLAADCRAMAARLRGEA